ncbi:MAG: sulfatase [Prolixibacteraceae bacterium]
MNHKPLPFLLLLLSISILFSCSPTGQSNPGKNSEEKYNVLFIAVDDLRPELGCYGKDYIHSPNIDKLASTGYVFNQAYCQVPVCGASRASILTGILPTQNRFLGYDARMDEDAPGITTLPLHFKNNGYYTVNYGKVQHFPDDQAHSWSEPPKRPDWKKLPDGSWSWEGWHDYQTKKNLEMDKNHPKRAGLPYEKADVPDSAYADGENIEMAKRKLSELKKLEQPFFFAVGLLKPHLPFNAPSKYWDLYNEEEIQLAPNPYLPQNVPEEGIMNFGELRAYAGVPQKGPVSDSLAHKLVHGYYACVSYVDALVGDLLNELNELELTDNTIVVLWSDHGYFLGEHGFWCKHALYELATRVPMILKLPGEQANHEINTMVDLIDIYPTLCELTNLPVPEHLQGKSFVKAFEDAGYQHRNFTYSRYFSGESIKKDGKRYTQYLTKEGELNAEMLYDHEKDPAENVNVADQRQYSDEIEEFSTIIDSVRNINLVK